jgi:DNA-binding IclR family transcriptional regulator
MTDDTLPSTAARTLKLVETLLANPQGATPQELLARLGGSRSSLFPLLHTLKRLGYAVQPEKRGRYYPGPRLAAWGMSPAAGHPEGALPAADLSQAFYQEAARRPCPETLALVLPSPGGPLVLSQVEGSRQVRCAFTPGQVYPALEAAGQVLAPLPQPTVQENGCALVAKADSLDLALPICRDGTHPEAALLLSAPAFRWQPQSLLDAHLAELRAMAARLSYRLGAPYYLPYRQPGDSELTPASPLASEEVTRFLQGPWTARLACLRPDGRPHVIPVWQEWDGQAFYVVAWQGSQWAEFVLQNPEVSLIVDEPWPPLRRVAARGRASLVEPGFDLGPLLQRLARRYLGQDAPPAPIHRTFRIQPETLKGWQGL